MPSVFRRREVKISQFLLSALPGPTSASLTRAQPNGYKAALRFESSIYTLRTTVPRFIIMDQRELDQTVKALTKSVQANEPAENSLKLLERLKKDAQPTEEMLRVRDARSSSPSLSEESAVLQRARCFILPHRWRVAGLNLGCAVRRY